MLIGNSSASERYVWQKFYKIYKTFIAEELVRISNAPSSRSIIY